MNRYWYLLSFVCLFWASCAIDDDVQINPCQDEFVGSYSLIDTSDEVFPYLDLPVESNIIFRNESGEEAIYNIEFPLSSVATSWIPRPCSENPDVQINYEYEFEFKTMEIRSEDNPTAFSMNLQVILDYDDPVSENVSDVFSIFTFDSIDNSFFGFQVFTKVANQRTSTLATIDAEYFESIEFNGMTYSDVYKTDYFNPFIILYYSLEFGIVAFKDRDDVQWVLDRIE